MARASRRRFLQLSAAAGAALALPPGGARAGTAAAPPLDPAAIPKYAAPLVVPPVMPRAPLAPPAAREVDYYEVAAMQFRQQVLPPGLPRTTVWGYGSIHHPGSFSSPAPTFEARAGRPVRVVWINGLVNGRGGFLPHLFPIGIDPALHWANPRGDHAAGPYTGPVPIVTHLHGGHSHEEADGYPEAWYLPPARDVPPGFARAGGWYQTFRERAEQRLGQRWLAGTAVFQYGNDQPATTLWFHDHTLGITRQNVYAGLAGFYLLRGGAHDLPPGVLPGPPSHEIPLAIQDRSFAADGSLRYPAAWAPAFLGTAMVVNGRTWPVLRVEPRRYRFRVLNACNTRFLILKLASDPLAARPAQAALPFWQLGADGGFLPSPVELAELRLHAAERADVVVDFTGLAPGTELYLLNEGPDRPFAGGRTGVDFPPADPATTGQVLKLVVVPLTAPDTSTPPGQLTLPAPPPPPAAQVTRELAMGTLDAGAGRGLDPRVVLLGTFSAAGPRLLRWGDPVTEHPALGATEVWELRNLTPEAHPIHLHQVQFQVVGRQPLDGTERPAEPWEAGLKDTVATFPGEITRIRATFNLPGRFVWHCHILEHEDNEMMRPYQVGG